MDSLRCQRSGRQVNKHTAGKGFPWYDQQFTCNMLYRQFTKKKSQRWPIYSPGLFHILPQYVLNTFSKKYTAWLGSSSMVCVECGQPSYFRLFKQGSVSTLTCCHECPRTPPQKAKRPVGHDGLGTSQNKGCDARPSNLHTYIHIHTHTYTHKTWDRVSFSRTAMTRVASDECHTKYYSNSLLVFWLTRWHKNLIGLESFFFFCLSFFLCTHTHILSHK